MNNFHKINIKMVYVYFTVKLNNSYFMMDFHRLRLKIWVWEQNQ